MCVLLKNATLKFTVTYKKTFVDTSSILRFNLINIRDKKFLT